MSATRDTKRGPKPETEIPAPAVATAAAGEATRTESEQAYDSYELAEAFRQLSLSEQAAKRELKEARLSKAELEQKLASVTAALETNVQKIEALEAAIAAHRKELENSDADAVEKRHLERQLVEANAKYENMLSQYEELYDYCDRLLAESESRRAALEQARKRLEDEKNQLKAEISRLEEEYVQTKHTESPDLIAARARLNETVARLEQATAQLEASKGVSAQLELKLKSLEERSYSYRMGVKRAYESLGQFVKTMEDLQRAMKGFIDTTVARGVSPVTSKAGNLLVEQFRAETDALRTIQDLLSEVLGKTNFN